ncbi:MAG: flagellar basal body rod protein FlgC [Clostridia bacterium]|nr:flagellar basal body rod protein FlgC [Clostridia bacterium]
MGYLDSLDISASGLTAQRLRMDVISKNIANMNTTRTETGDPYRRKTVVFAEQKDSDSFKNVLGNAVDKAGGGVKVTGIIEDTSPYKRVYNPEHPDADQEGYVNMPNINIIEEMVNMISATRSYEANITCFNSSKSMLIRALDIGKL